MHVIRLRDPWEVETIQGVVRYRRWFNKPTGIDAGTIVQLVIDDLDPTARVELNDEPLAVLSPDNPQSWPITEQLCSRNAVTIDIDGAGETAQRPFGEVRLEIGIGQSPP